MRANIVTLVVVVAAIALFLRHALEYPPTPLRIAGLALLMPSFLLLVLARIQLGRAFSVKAKASELVTVGLYSRIRNPIYVFGGLMIVGIILWAQRPIFLLIFVLLVPLQVYRARKEAQVLHAKFGSAYLEYKQETWF